MRALSAQFMNDLVEPAGLLHSILIQVKKDQTLMLAIRDGYINIYYRGGNILNVREHNLGSYKTFFDENYDLRFFVASFAGYALHADCMLSLAEFRKLL